MSATPNFLLTPQQQELLFAALHANRPSAPSNSGLTLSPASLNTSPMAADPSSLSKNINGLSDYEYSFDAADSSLDFSFAPGDDSGFIIEGTGDDMDGESKTDSSPSINGNDSPDKRGLEDDDDGVTSSKRRESSDKIPKKPGRKPLTSEPSSKRKAQNRAAQRAFRERKEKHLKDLETKVAELEKISQAAKQENGQLRVQVEKMAAELNEYKKRVTLGQAPVPPNRTAVFGNALMSNLNDVSFQFEFPKFGQLPGPTPTPRVNSSSTSSTTGTSPAMNNSLSSPTSASTTATSRVTAASKSPKDDLSKVTTSFAPPLTSSNNGMTATSRTSLDSNSTSSPSASSNSNTAPSSSCGTSPEPYNQSPLGFKPVDTLTTIGEEQPAMSASTNATQDFSQFMSADGMPDMGWLGPQSNFRFDPQLFGDYREPQENILSNGGFDDSFFNDALDVDFVTPFNMAPSPIVSPKQPNLIAQIDAAKDGEFESSSINPKPVQPPVGNSNIKTEHLTCTKIWEKLQACPKVQSGDFDLDGLCSDLQKKAKCSGSGAVVDEQDFKVVMSKYLCHDGQNMLGEIKGAVVIEKE